MGPESGNPKKMSKNRSLLLLASAVMIVLLLGGGLALRVAADESSYRRTVLFAEVLSRVLDNYVDPVEAETLLEGAYEGMLSGLDPNGAYLTPVEVERWRAQKQLEKAGPGITVLKYGRTLQVAAVAAGSPAADAEIEIGDHIRSIDEMLVRNLSLEQARRLIGGGKGSEVKLELLHPDEGFRREELTLQRVTRPAGQYDLKVVDGTAVLSPRGLAGAAAEELLNALDDVQSRGVGRLLLDLRNVADGGPRSVGLYSGIFAGGAELQLRDRSGRLIESVKSPAGLAAWPGSLAVLVNGATAGGAEGLALLIQDQELGEVFGESTYGLGSEAKLFELENGAGLLVSVEVWETASSERWNGEGVQPDRVVAGEGDDYDEMQADQLKKVLGMLLEGERRPAEEGAEAA
jgi:carboxyl-terminal processing protease